MLVPDSIVLDVGAQRQGRGLTAAVEEDRGSSYDGGPRWVGAQVVHEPSQRAFPPGAACGDDLAAALPGHHDRERGDGNDQR